MSDILLNRNEINKVYQSNKRLIQKKDPIFMDPTSNIGRAHFYAPNKLIASEICCFALCKVCKDMSGVNALSPSFWKAGKV